MTRTIVTSPATTDPDVAHREALARCRTHAEKIRYACEQVSDPAIMAVQDWLAAYGVHPALPYLSSVVNGWRQDHGLESTSDLPRLTPELLAELDGMTNAGTSSVLSNAPSASRGASSVMPEESSTTTVLIEHHEDVASRVQDANQRQQSTRPRGWVVAWVSFVTGGLVSVAANVAHTLYPTPAQLEAWMSTGRPVDAWTPSPGAMAFAAFWPIALILSVEVLTRVSWRPGILFGLARYGGTTIVAAVAAVMSYRHMSGLLTIWGEDTLGAHLGPLAVDGLMVIAASALLSMNRPRKPMSSTA